MFNIFRKNPTPVGSAAYWEQRSKTAEGMLHRQIGFTEQWRANALDRKLELQKLQKACARKSRQLARLRGENVELNRVLAVVDWAKQDGQPPWATATPVKIMTVEAVGDIAGQR